MYTVTNYKTKKALKEALAAGKRIEVYQPGPFGGGPIPDGQHCLEGPHYPQPHTWYVTATIKNGVVEKVK